MSYIILSQTVLSAVKDSLVIMFSPLSCCRWLMIAQRPVRQAKRRKNMRGTMTTRSACPLSSKPWALHWGLRRAGGTRDYSRTWTTHPWIHAVVQCMSVCVCTVVALSTSFINMWHVWKQTYEKCFKTYVLTTQKFKQKCHSPMQCWNIF